MSRNNSQILEERRERLLRVIETEFSSSAEFCRKMELSHNWVNYFKNADEPPTINDSILSSLYELKKVNPLWVISGVGEKKYPPEKPGRENPDTPEEEFISQFMQAHRLIESIGQKPASAKDAEQLGDLALKCSQLTTRLLELQRQAQSDLDE